ncbi:dihydrofolate reductase family protein [Streptomyces sp. 7N604]|uniref:dihydrofolate reductase family protein n=1 Tax=Streptomyces sp. 7N604 TaxID=3457415 RepID=UPI003FD4FD09
MVHALIAAGLVDEYRLFVYPVVLGHGTCLFTETVDGMGMLRMVETRLFNSGVVLLRYRVV